MGLVDTLWRHVSFKSAAAFVVVFYTLYYLYNRLDEHFRLKRLGNRGFMISPRLPLGIDFIIRSIRYTVDQANLELWRDVLIGPSPCATSETRIVNQRIVFTSDPENIKAMLATQFTDFGKGEPFHAEWQEFLGDSIFTTDGASWHQSRQLIRPQFTKDRVSDLHCFETHFQTLLRGIYKGGPLDGEHEQVDMNIASGRVVDISDLFFRMTLDITTDFLLGADVKSLSTVNNPFAEAFNNVQRLQNIIARTGKLRGLYPKGEFRRSLHQVETFINHYVERTLRLTSEELEAHTKTDAGYTFLHELARTTRDPKQLRDQIMAVLLAGRDTTASTLSWALYELSRTPHAVAKLRSEIQNFVGDESQAPTYEHLKNMPYLRAILNETLRLYPSVPFNVRLALKDTTLPRGGGPDGSEPLPVLKNTPCGYSTLVMQRDPSRYPPVSESFADPAIFSPERWNVWHPRPHDYIPFNAGPRICIGQQFALTEIGYVLTRMMQKFDRVESFMHEIDGGKPKLKAEIVLQPGDGVKVALWEAKKQ